MSTRARPLVHVRYANLVGTWTVYPWTHHAHNPIGQCMRVFADTLPCTVVVGVAEDMVQRDLAATQRYHFYLSIDQFMRTQGNGMRLRLRGDPAVQGESVRKALQRVMPRASYLTVQPLDDIVNGAQRSSRLGATLLIAFGSLALLVAAIGVYGVISYNVAQRTHELGVRIALGATSSRILRMVVGQSVRFITIGIAVGSQRFAGRACGAGRSQPGAASGVASRSRTDTTTTLRAETAY